MSQENPLSATLSAAPNAGVIPTSFAEKAMASLLQLHSELMEEKEKRVNLYRRLMDKEQSVAELKMYVKVLEERLAIVQSARVAPKPAPDVGDAVAAAAAAARVGATTAPVQRAPVVPAPPKQPQVASVRATPPKPPAPPPAPVGPPPLETSQAAARARRITQEMRAISTLPPSKIRIPQPPAQAQGAIPSKFPASLTTPSAGLPWTPASVPASAVMGARGQDARLDGWKAW